MEEKSIMKILNESKMIDKSIDQLVSFSTYIMITQPPQLSRLDLLEGGDLLRIQPLIARQTPTTNRPAKNSMKPNTTVIAISLCVEKANIFQ